MSAGCGSLDGLDAFDMGRRSMVLLFHRQIAHSIAEVIGDPACAPSTRESVARFARRTADLLKRDRAAFNYEWFFGACGLDHWGETVPETNNG